MQTRVRYCLVLMASIFAASNCNNPGGPGPTLAFTLTASPNPITGSLCTGCGAGSTDREAATTLTLRETGGREGTVTSVLMTLRVAATGAVLAQGELTAAALQSSGTNRVPASGTLNVPVAVHYPGSNQGQAATFTLVVRVTDSAGTVATQEITVTVTST